MDKESNLSDFDFEVWSQMAQQDPEKFEAMRQQLINDLIAQAPLHLKQRLTGLQWQVDQIRKQASNPMVACLQISQRMWDNAVGEKGLLDALQEPQKILNAIENESTGKILSFDKYKPGK